MKTPQIEGSATPRGRRGIVLIVVGVLATGLSIGGVGRGARERTVLAADAP